LTNYKGITIQAAAQQGKKIHCRNRRLDIKDSQQQNIAAKLTVTNIRWRRESKIKKAKPNKEALESKSNNSHGHGSRVRVSTVNIHSTD
jgi:hypothetical protein